MLSACLIRECNYANCKFVVTFLQVNVFQSIYLLMVKGTWHQNGINKIPRDIYIFLPGIFKKYLCHYQYFWREKLLELLDYNLLKSYHIAYLQGCTWAFTCIQKLSRHMVQHTGDRKHMCDRPGCQKLFTRLEHLKTHLKTHTGEKPFACPEKGKYKSRCSETLSQISITKERFAVTPCAYIFWEMLVLIKNQWLTTLSLTTEELTSGRLAL